MGFEYKIKFDIADVKTVEGILKSLSSFSNIEIFENRDLYNYRFSDNRDKMPNAHAEILADGIYFCDYAGGSPMLHELISAVSKLAGPPEIIDYSIEGDIV